MGQRGETAAIKKVRVNPGPLKEPGTELPQSKEVCVAPRVSPGALGFPNQGEKVYAHQSMAPF